MVKKGFALCIEGDTERVFYICLFEFLCKKYDVNFSKIEAENGNPAYFVLSKQDVEVVVVFSQQSLPKNAESSVQWFNLECCQRYKECESWTMYVCCDTDSYNRSDRKPECFKKIKEKFDRWNKCHKNRGKYKCYDMSAVAEIEDIFFLDLQGILNFLGITGSYNKNVLNSSSGGKARLQNLYKEAREKYEFNGYYHEGERAKDLIHSLDMQKILDNCEKKCAHPHINKAEEQIFESF